MTLVLNAQDVEQSTDMHRLIEVIEQGLREEALDRAVVPPRLNLSTQDGFFRVMPAVMNESGLMGYKVFHGSLKAGVRYLIAIYDQQEGGRLLALMDAHYLTAARTGATTGIATKLLVNQGAQTVAVIGSGLDAGLKAAHFQPTIILLDILLPGLNGLDVCKNLKNNPKTKNMTIMVISASLQYSDKSVRAAGGDMFFKKPVDFKELLEKCNEVIENNEKIQIPT